MFPFLAFPVASPGGNLWFGKRAELLVCISITQAPIYHLQIHRHTNHINTNVL